MFVFLFFFSFSAHASHLRSESDFFSRSEAANQKPVRHWIKTAQPGYALSSQAFQLSSQTVHLMIDSHLYGPFGGNPSDVPEPQRAEVDSKRTEAFAKLKGECALPFETFQSCLLRFPRAAADVTYCQQWRFQLRQCLFGKEE